MNEKSSHSLEFGAISLLRWLCLSRVSPVTSLLTETGNASNITLQFNHKVDMRSGTGWNIGDNKVTMEAGESNNWGNNGGLDVGPALSVHVREG